MVIVIIWILISNLPGERVQFQRLAESFANALDRIVASSPQPTSLPTIAPTTSPSSDILNTLTASISQLSLALPLLLTFHFTSLFPLQISLSSLPLSLFSSYHYPSSSVLYLCPSSPSSSSNLLPYFNFFSVFFAYSRLPSYLSSSHPHCFFERALG